MKRPLKLHLHFLNLHRLLFLFCLEVEVINVVGVEGLDPFGDDETLLKQLHLLVLLVVDSVVCTVQVHLELCREKQYHLVHHLVQ